MIEKKNKKSFRLVKKLNKSVIRRQDAPKVYDVNASIYIWSRKSILNQKQIINQKTGTYLMPEERSIDIDSKFDWTLVQYLLKKKKCLIIKKLD